MTHLSIQNIHKSFGRAHALRGISFDVAPGEIVALQGVRPAKGFVDILNG